MFEIQENHVREILIVNMTNFVLKKDVFLPIAMKTVIVIMNNRATNAFLINVLFDVNIEDNVRMAKTVSMTFVPFHQVILSM